MGERTLGMAKGNRRGFARWAIVGLAVVMIFSVPTAARGDNNLGGGAVQGTFDYGSTPMPPTLSVCESTTFDVEMQAGAFVFNTVISGYAGTVTITGDGASNCESMSLGGGTLSNLSLEGGPTPNESVIDCGPLEGGYTRVFTRMTVVLSGECTVNQFGTGNVNFIGQFDVVPAGLGGEGFLAPVTSAQVEGSFTISPAS